jgi:hypothetical protein
MASYDEFLTWDDVLRHAKSGRPLLYRAAGARTPWTIRVVKVYKNKKIRIDPMASGYDNFTADSAHLTRFLRRV